MTVGEPYELSFAVIADQFSTIRRVVECLCEQGTADRIELVVAAPEPSAFKVPHDVRVRLGGVQVIQGEIESLPQARAATIRAARAPLVVFGETHSFPEQGWAEALIGAHRGPWVAVGPTIANANPESAIAWSNLLLDYGPFIEREGGPVPRLMGHNSVYKREALVAYGPRLETLLLSDEVLNEDLRSLGSAFYLEPAARTRHLNVSHRRPWVAERFLAGRVFAAERARAWPWRRRFLYAGGSPLIPLVRLTRVLRDVRRVHPPRRGFLAWIMAPLSVGLVVSAAGELLGYASGVRDRDRRRLYELEVFRAQFVSSPRPELAGSVLVRER